MYVSSSVSVATKDNNGTFIDTLVMSVYNVSIILLTCFIPFLLNDFFFKYLPRTLTIYSIQYIPLGGATDRSSTAAQRLCRGQGCKPDWKVSKTPANNIYSQGYLVPYCPVPVLMFSWISAFQLRTT